MATISQAALEVINKLNKAGFQAVIAGGWVRDMLLSVESKDIDIATNAMPNHIEQLFENVKFVGRDFGVSLVKHLDEEFEVATFRKDGPYLDGRHPSSVEFCSMEEDAKRRDLTMNALFYDPFNNEVIDYVDGRSDIKHFSARFVGNPEDRIKEDYIRMLRIVRFANRFKFHMAEFSFTALLNNAHLIAEAPAERVALEMNKILEQCNSNVFMTLHVSNLLKYILPELEEGIGCEQPPQFHPEGDVWIHTMLALDEVKKLDPSLELLWATLLHDIAKPRTQHWDDVDKRFRFNRHEQESAVLAEEILTRLRFSNAFQERVCNLVGSHMKFSMVCRMKTAKLKRFVFQPYFDEHLKLHTADCLSSHGDLDHRDFCAQKLLEFKAERPDVDSELPKPIVTGKLLIAGGMTPGPEFKNILEQCMDAQLEGTFSDIEGAISYIINNFWDKFETKAPLKEN